MELVLSWDSETTGKGNCRKIPFFQFFPSEIIISRGKLFVGENFCHFTKIFPDEIIPDKVFYIQVKKKKFSAIFNFSDS